MSTNLVNKDTGELVTLANGTRMWIGTKTAHDLAVQQGTMPNNCMVCITDDYQKENTDWTTTETDGITYKIKNGIVFVRIYMSTSIAAGGSNIGRLPEGARPDVIIDTSFVVNNNTDTPYHGRIDNAGNIRIWGLNAQEVDTSNILGWVSFPLA